MNAQTRSPFVLFALAMLTSIVGAIESHAQDLPAPESLEAWALQEREQTFAIAEERGWDDAQAHANMALYRLALAANVRKEREAWTQCAETALHARFLSNVDEELRADAAALLRKHPELAQRFLFLLNDNDDATEAARVLLTMHAAFPERVGDFPSLAAAMAVVHDRDVSVRANENTKKAPPADLLFAYFVDQRNMMWVDLKSSSPHMLCFVVDATPELSELFWAVDRFGRRYQIGTLYHQIEYDREHYFEGKPKKVSVEGFSLPNIDRYGGVCVDQAYFASMVGKALGVPSTMVSGASDSGEGHCWLGYVRKQGSNFVWDMDDGRYPEARLLAGVARDPQSGQWVNESEIGVLEGLFSRRPADAHHARAVMEGARLLFGSNGMPAPIELAATRAQKRTSGNETHALQWMRQPGPDDAQALLREALRSARDLPEIWSLAVAMAPKMERKDLGWWIDQSSRVGGRRWPQFTFDVTSRMLSKLDDDEAAMLAWDRVVSRYRSRPDLALRARVAAAKRAEKAGRHNAAYQAYEQAIKEYSGQGPDVLVALHGAQAFLEEKGRVDLYVDMIAESWRRTQRPTNSTMLFEQTVWARVGLMYAEALEAVGRFNEAQGIRRQILSARPAQ